MEHRIAFIVPTKDRRDDLAVLLASFRAQTRPPDQVILVDGGDDTVEDLVSAHDDLPIDYLRVYPPGFTRQKNAGTAAIRADVTLVGYLDDDIELDPAAIEEMMRFWDSAPADAGGAQFHITDMSPAPATALTRFFGTNDGRGGTLMRSGFNVILWPVPPGATEVQWLSGGATVWRRDIVEGIPHDEWFAGYGHMDDVDYSVTAAHAGWRMYVLGDARCEHHERPFAPEREYAFGVYDTVNRYHLVGKYPDRFSKVRWLWATIGKLLGRTVRGTVRGHRPSLDRARGYARGLARVARGDLDSDGSLK